MCVASAVIAILHRLAWSNYPSDVDPINFTVALRHYSVAEDAPHPPGYPLFVLAGRLASRPFGENHAYQAVNLLMLLAAGWFIYATLRRFGARLVGLLCALLFMTHPITLAATVVPEVYISDAFFGSAIAFSVLRRNGRSTSRAVQALAIFVALGLFRPASCAMLWPLAVGGTALFCPAPRWKTAVVVGIAAGIGAAGAWAMTVYLAGGLPTYRAATDRVMGAAFRASSVLGGAPVSAHLKMLLKLGAWLVMLGLPGLLVALFAKRTNRSARIPIAALAVLVLWIAPPLGLYALVYYLKPTYHLIYAPCLMLPLAWGLVTMGSRWPRSIPLGLAAAIVGAQLVFFFGAPSRTPAQLFRLTRPYFAGQDRGMAGLAARLHEIPKVGTLVLWVGDLVLPTYALRTVGHTDDTGIMREDNRNASYFDPDTMRWAPSTDHDEFIPDRFARVAVIHDAGGTVSVDVIELSPGQSRRITDLLARFQEQPQPR